jgi:glycosyltransferase involved in cell wall biosynthesis
VQVQPRLHLLVVGTGELMAQAQALAAQWSLPVTFAGFLNQTEIASAYVASDCLVLPSDHGETWGLVVNEAMACGRPAIVSDRVGCGPDLVSEGETGSAVPFGDVAALAKCLVQLADGSKLAVMGAKARARVTDGYSVDHAVAGTLAALRHALGPRP